MEGNIRWQLIYGPEVFSVKFLVEKIFYTLRKLCYTITTACLEYLSTNQTL